MFLSSKDYRKYIGDIKAKMHCSSNMKQSFISDFSERINEFITENSNVTIEKIIEEFGTPEEIADSFNSHNNTMNFEKKAKQLKITNSALFALVIIIITFLTLMLLKYCGLITVTNPY